MNLPDEVWDYTVQFMRIEEQLQFRLTSLQGCISVQHVEDIDEHRIYGRIYHWKQCFPWAKYLNTLGHLVKEEEFPYLKGIEVLQLGCVLANESLFHACDKLKSLTIHCSRNPSKPLQDTMFQPLVRLRSLRLYDSTLTDQVFDYLPHLEELSLVNCAHVTSQGIRRLKKLKRLFLFEQVLADEAFEGLGLEELSIHYDDVISDQGICQLSKLQILRCSNTRIRCEFRDMPHLHTLHLIRSTVHTGPDFQNLHHLTLQFCHVKGDSFEPWKTLESLEFLEVTFEDPHVILSLLLLPGLKRLTLIGSPQLEPYVPALREKFHLYTPVTSA